MNFDFAQATKIQSSIEQRIEIALISIAVHPGESDSTVPTRSDVGTLAASTEGFA
jgi:hypothetical protein